MTATPENISTFALMVDKLRTMSEAELKLAYIKLFQEELDEKWKSLVAEMKLGSIDDEEILDALNNDRQSGK